MLRLLLLLWVWLVSMLRTETLLIFQLFPKRRHDGAGSLLIKITLRSGRTTRRPRSRLLSLAMRMHVPHLFLH